MTAEHVANMRESFNTRLLSANSATAVLEEWCGSPIAAYRVAKPITPLTFEQKKRLQVDDGSRIAYRCVDLSCGDVVLSRAENWYRPDLLTDRMLHILEETDTTFGRVIRSLNPRRTNISVSSLSSPGVVEHQALLTIDGRPLCEVRERYTEALLLFGCEVITQTSRDNSC